MRIADRRGAVEILSDRRRRVDSLAAARYGRAIPFDDYLLQAIEAAQGDSDFYHHHRNVGDPSSSWLAPLQ
jgi:hypothetical protein